MKFNNKAQGLSLNTVIVAAIVIIVLVVIVVIFTKGMGDFSGELPSCTSKGGYCDSDCGAYNYPVRNTDCDEGGLLCCVPRDSTSQAKCSARGGYCAVDATSNNDVSGGREDCPHGESCWVESPCSISGGNCRLASDGCAMSRERADSARCRSYPERLVCCKP
jgi:hypothetical protein